MSRKLYDFCYYINERAQEVFYYRRYVGPEEWPEKIGLTPVDSGKGDWLITDYASFYWLERHWTYWSNEEDAEQMVKSDLPPWEAQHRDLIRRGTWEMFGVSRDELLDRGLIRE